MELSTALKFMDAINASGIKKYQFDTDLGTHYYNNDNSIIVIDQEESAVINIRKPFTSDTDCYNNKLMLYVSNFCDIHEARVGGDYETIKKFMESYGLPLDSEQLKILINIDRANYTIMPETGNYLSAPKIKTQDEINKMSPEEKEQYEKEIAEYEESVKKKGLTQGVAAQITL